METLDKVLKLGFYFVVGSVLLGFWAVIMRGLILILLGKAEMV